MSEKEKDERNSFIADNKEYVLFRTKKWDRYHLIMNRM